MKSLAFFALSAIATAAMAGPVAAPPAMGTISITGTSSQTLVVNGGSVKNTANDYTYANQNIASNKGNATISGISTQSSTLTGATVTNEAVKGGDVAVQNLASNVGNTTVGPLTGSFPLIKGTSTQTANVSDATVENKAQGQAGCRGFDCDNAAIAYQNVASNMGNINIPGNSSQTANVSGHALVSNFADGAASRAVQNIASNYGDVTVSGTSIQVASIYGGAVVANLAKGNYAHAAQNLASNDSCMPPPPICIGPACSTWSHAPQ